MVLKTGKIAVEDFEIRPDWSIAYVLFAPHLVACIGMEGYLDNGVIGYLALMKTDAPLGPVHSLPWKGAKVVKNIWNPKWFVKKMAKGQANFEDLNKVLDRLRREHSVKT